jgi:hypothetical protein
MMRFVKYFAMAVSAMFGALAIVVGPTDPVAGAIFGASAWLSMRGLWKTPP